MTIETITSTEIGEHYGRILRDAAAGQAFVITRYGVPYAAIIDFESLRDWIKHGELKNKELVALLRKIDSEIEVGLGDRAE